MLPVQGGGAQTCSPQEGQAGVPCEQTAGDKGCNSRNQCVWCGKAVGRLAARAAHKGLYASSTCRYYDGGRAGFYNHTVHVNSYSSAEIVGEFDSATEVVVFSEEVDVRGFRGDLTVHGAEKVSVQGGNARIVVEDSERVAVNLDGVSGDVGIISSTGSVVAGACTGRLRVIVQPKQSGDVATAMGGSCGTMAEVINVGDMLSVFGSDYEMQFFDADDVAQSTEQHVLIIMSTAAAGAAVLISVFICFKRR